MMGMKRLLASLSTLTLLLPMATLADNPYEDYKSNVLSGRENDAIVAECRADFGPLPRLKQDRGDHQKTDDEMENDSGSVHGCFLTAIW